MRAINKIVKVVLAKIIQKKKTTTTSSNVKVSKIEVSLIWSLIRTARLRFIIKTITQGFEKRKDKRLKNFDALKTGSLEGVFYADNSLTLVDTRSISSTLYKSQNIYLTPLFFF